MLTACSNEVVSVEFYVDGVLYDSYKVEVGGYLDEIPEVPVKDGYVGKWDVADFDEITEPIKVNAIYTKNVYTVTFIADGTIVATRTANVGKPITDVPEVPHKEGYTGEWNVTNFVGITVDTIVNAVYSRDALYASFYDSEYDYTPATVKYGDRIKDKIYYVADGMGYTLTSDTKFKEGTIYYTRSRKLIAKIAVEDGIVTGIPELPTKDNVSVKWMQEIVNGEEITYVNPSYKNVTSNITIVAYSFVTVTLIDDAFDTQVTDFTTCDIGESFDSISSVREDVEDYEFFGWYFDSEFLRPVTFPCSFNTNVAIYAKWVSVKSSEGLAYLDGKVVEYTGTETEVYVPYKYSTDDGKEYMVTAISESAFKDNVDILSIYMPSTLTAIENDAFYGCTNLTDVFYTDGCYVENIGNNAFRDCVNLISTDVSSITASIGEYAFSGCEQLNSINGMSNSVITEISNSLFADCTSLEVISIPATVTAIGEYAFSGAILLDIEFVNANKLTKIGSYAFANCHKFSGVEAPNLEEMGNNVFDGCYSMTKGTILGGGKLTALFSKEIESGDEDRYYTVSDENSELTYVPKLLYSVTVSVGEGKVGDKAFFDFYSVKRVTLAEGITEIGEYAFGMSEYDVTEGEFTINFSSMLTDIGEYAFNGRKDLLTLNLPQSVVSIGEYAFYNINLLSKVNVSEKNAISNVGAYAFDGTAWKNDYVGVIKLGTVCLGISESYCRKNGITEIKASDMSGIKSIAPYAFYENTVIQKVELGNEVNVVGDYAFANMSVLKKFAFNSNQSNAVARVVGEYVLDKNDLLEELTVYEDVEVTTLASEEISSLKVLHVNNDGINVEIQKDRYNDLDTIEELSIGDGYTVIGENAFEGMDSLVSVTLGKDVVDVKKFAFSNNASLTTVDFSNNEVLVSIEEGAFKDTALDKLALPTSVVNIGDEAFMNTKVSSFVASNNLQSIGKGAFMNTPVTIVTFNNDLVEIGAYAFKNCQIRSFVIPENTIIGEGILIDNASLNELTISHGLIITELFSETVEEQTEVRIPVNFNTVIVKKGEIIERQFYGVNNLQIVNLSSGVTGIGKEAFFGINTLTRVTIPSTVEYIGDYAFKNCTQLSVCQIDSSNSCLTAVGNGIFSGCTSLTYAVFPNTVTDSEWKEIYDGCEKLVTANLPSQINVVGDYAYRGCKSIVTVNMHDKVVSIGKEAFLDCHAIEFDDVGFDKVEVIGDRAFANCYAFHGIKSPNAQQIGENSYSGCTSVTEITVAGEAISYYIDNSDGLVTINVTGSATLPTDYFENCNNLEVITYYGEDVATATCIADNFTEINAMPLIFVKDSVYAGLQNNSDVLQKIHRNPTAISFYYEINDKGVTITGINGEVNDSVIYLPSVATVSGSQYAVTAIGNSAFKGVDGIDTVIIPTSIELIGMQAFGETNVKKVSFESGSKLTTIGAYAFYDCKLIESMLIPSSVQVIEEDAFYGCTSLSEVTFFSNSKLTSIGEYAFYNTTELQRFEIKGAVTSIGAHAFEYSGITSFDYGTKSTITVIKESTFANTQLAEIALPDSVQTIEKGAFKRFLGTSLRLPEELTTIGDNAFESSGNLTNVEFNEKLEIIGKEVFIGCTGIEEAILPDSVISIGEGAFSGCTAIAKIKIGSNVSYVGNRAFYETRNVSSLVYNAKKVADFEENNGVFYNSGYNTDGIVVEIGKTVNTIPQYFFYAETNSDRIPKLASVTFEQTASCESIGAYAFAYVEDLESIVIPVRVSSIGENAFYGCIALKIKLEAHSKPARFNEKWNGSVLNLEYGYNNVVSGDYTYVVHENKAYLTAYEGSDTEIVVPSTIDGYVIAGVGTAFEKNTTLTHVELPSNITTVGSFYECTSLSTISIEANLERIQDYAFYGCSALSYVTINASVKNVGDNAFGQCTSLKTVYIDSEDIAKAILEQNSVGSLCENALSVYVNKEVSEVGEYVNNDYHVINNSGINDYNVYTKLYWNVSETETDNVYAYLLTNDIATDTYKLYVEGNGNMANFNDYSVVDWYGDYHNKIISVDLGANVTKFGNYAFYGLENLEEVNLYSTDVKGSATNGHLFTNSGKDDGLILNVKDNVSTIPAYMFFENANLTDIVYESTALKTIEDYAFAYNVGLTEVNVIDSVESIGAYAFNGCTNVKTATLGKGMKTIGARAFYDVKSLETINFYAVEMENLSGDNAVFASQYSLSEEDVGITLSIGSEVKVIPAYLFYNCDFLVNVEFSSIGILNTIGAYAFASASVITNITLPASLVTLGNNAFAECIELGDIAIAQNCKLNFIGNNAFFNTLYYGLDANWVDEVLYLGNYLIKALPAINEDYSIKTGTTVVAENAFNGCNQLKYVSLPQSLQYVNDNAFNGCSQLKTVYIASRYVASGAIDVESYGRVLENAMHVYISENLISGVKIQVGKYITDIYNLVETDTVINKVVYNSYTTARWDANTDQSSVYGYLITDTSSVGNYVLKIKGSGNMVDFNAAGNAVWKDYIERISKVIIFDGVTSIGAYAFANMSNMGSVTFEGNVKVAVIGIGAFNNCTALTSVTIPSTVTEIKARAFYNCISLSQINYQAINCADLIAGNNAFTYVGQETEGVTVNVQNTVGYIPSNLFNSTGESEGAPKIAWVEFKSINNVNLCSKIGDYAFAYCDNLYSVAFAMGANLKTIGDYAFAYCTKLITINLTAGINAVGKGAFINCEGVTEVVFNATEFYVAVEDNAPFEGVGVSEGYKLSVSAKSKSIPAHLFERSAKLISISYGADCILENIGTKAFEDCTGLTEINVPQSVKTIDEGAFSGCSSLLRYVAPFIGGQANEIEATEKTTFGYVFGKEQKSYTTATTQYYSSVGANTYYVPDSLIYVESTLYSNVYYGMFHNCKKLVTVKMNSNTGIQTVDRHEYNSAGDIVSTTSVVNGSVLGVNAFRGCSSLGSVTLPEQVLYIDDNAFNGCVQLRSFTISRYVTGIGESAFANCEWLTNVNFDAENCEDMDEDVFVYAGTKQGGITVNFGTMVTRVPANMFFSSKGDVNLYEIKFQGDACTSIGKNAFAMTEGLEKVTLPDSITTIEENAFEGSKYYDDNNNWVNGVLYINNCLIKAKNSIVSGTYAVNNRTITIADYAFKDCKYLTVINVPVTVTHIGKEAFSGCSGLRNYVSDSNSQLTSIGEKAFYGCVALGSETDELGNVKGMTITSGVKYIGDSCFELCTKLTVVYLDSSDVVVGLSINAIKVFGYVCGYAETIYIREGITLLGTYITNAFLEAGTNGAYTVYEKRDNNNI